MEARHVAVPHPVWPERQCICQAPIADPVHIIARCGSRADHAAHVIHSDRGRGTYSLCRGLDAQAAR